MLVQSKFQSWSRLREYLYLEQAEGEGLVDREGSTDTQPESHRCAEQEDAGSNGATERILELVDTFDEGNQDQAQGNRASSSNTKKFIW